MSVSHPLIKELKKYTASYIQNYGMKHFVGEHDKQLVCFEKCLENIFYDGIKATSTFLGFAWSCDPWAWIEKLAQVHTIQNHIYDINEVIRNVKQCRTVFTNTGRFRLFVRSSLMRKCFHCPLEFLCSADIRDKYYIHDSIIGNDILCEILLSVLYELSKITFDFNLFNAFLLDYTWELGEICNIEVMPTTELGVSLTYSGDHAIIMHIRPNSLLADIPQVSIGDCLEAVNGVQLTASLRTRFSNLLKTSRHAPVRLRLIKAMANPVARGRLHPGMVELYKRIKLDPDFVRHCILNKIKDTSEVRSTIKLRQWRSGFNLVYMGSVRVAYKATFEVIDDSYGLLMDTPSFTNLGPCERTRIDVMFELGELGVKFSRHSDQELIQEHSYMEISSCGTVTIMPKYVCYIAGKEFCNMQTDYKCYFFMAPSESVVKTILKALGQGFKRTTFLV